MSPGFGKTDLSSYPSMVLPEINDERTKSVSKNILDRICTAEFDEALKRTDPENRTTHILDALMYAWGAVVEMNNLSDVIELQKDCYLRARGVSIKHMSDECRQACIDFNNAIRSELLSRLHPALKYDIDRAMAIFLEESADYNNASEAGKYFIYQNKILDVIEVVKSDCNSTSKNSRIKTDCTRLSFPIVHNIYKNLNDFPVSRNCDAIQEMSRTILYKVKRTEIFDRLRKEISDGVGKRILYREFIYYQKARIIFNGLLMAWTGRLPLEKRDFQAFELSDLIKSARTDWVKADGVEQIFNEKLKLLLSEQFYIPSFTIEKPGGDFEKMLKVRERYEDEVRKIREAFKGKSDERKLVNAAVGEYLVDVINALNKCDRGFRKYEEIALGLGWHT